jgi:hypothetical protein
MAFSRGLGGSMTHWILEASNILAGMKKASHLCKALIFLAFFGSPTWARTRDLRINRLPLDLHANPHECSLSGVRASNISCPFHLKKAWEGVIRTAGYWKRKSDGFHAS